MKKIAQSTFFAGLSLLVLSSAMLFVPVSLANAQWYTSLPICDETKVLDKIVRRFNKAESSLWHNGVGIGAISGAYERAFNIYPDSSINRRYCRAKAYMSNGRYRPLHFVIEQGMGLAGFGWGVEYCLRGSDRWHAYDGWCRVLRK